MEYWVLTREKNDRFLTLTNYSRFFLLALIKGYFEKLKRKNIEVEIRADKWHWRMK